MNATHRVAAGEYHARDVHDLVKPGPLRELIGLPDARDRYSVDQLERLPPEAAERIISFLDTRKGLGFGATAAGAFAAVSLLGPASAAGAAAGLLCLGLWGVRGIHSAFRPDPIG